MLCLYNTKNQSMKAIQFPQVSNNIAEDQDEYSTLPSWVGDVEVDTSGRKETAVVCCFSIDDEELARINKYKRVWYRALTFGRPLHPFNIFAVRDYFDDSSWLEHLSDIEDTNLSEVHHVQIKMKFWQRFWFMIIGKEYIHVRVYSSSKSVVDIKVEQAQDEFYTTE